VLHRLKLLNLGLEIDDFGTGYSSLSQLHLLPFDTLKIDRSFVHELGSGAEGNEIVRTILELARSLEMQIVAEGVETRDQLRMLAELGCNCVQGFYFSKPLNPEVTTTLMEERRQLSLACDMPHGVDVGLLAPGLDVSTEDLDELYDLPRTAHTNAVPSRC